MRLPARRLRSVYQSLFDSHGPQAWWPGDSPFEIMVGAVLTQNTAWINVERAMANLIDAQVLDAARILDLEECQLAECLRPSGYFNIKAKRLRNFCRWYVDAGAYQQYRSWMSCG